MASTSTPSDSHAGVQDMKVLCLDGGGVKGLSSLLILEHLMEEIKIANSLPERPEPAQCFDLICGTSTGGLIALMLGHLGISLQRCIQQYLDLSEEIFNEGDISKIYNVIRDGARFATLKLEKVLKTIADDAKMNVPKGDHHTKVCVLAIRESTHSPHQFRNYGPYASPCYVWEVGRATSAASTLFEPITMGNPPENFIDAGIGYNNPSKMAKFEVSELRSNIGCLVSIGTGHPTYQIPEKSANSFFRFSGPKKTAEVFRMLKDVATDCERVHDELYQEFQAQNKADCYFRFNVPQGLESIQIDDYRNSKHLTSVTRTYCGNPESKARLRACATKIKLSLLSNYVFHRAYYENFDWAVSNSSTSPRPTAMFTGRRHPWEGTFIDHTWRLKNETGETKPLFYTLKASTPNSDVRDVKASARVRFVEPTYNDTIVGISCCVDAEGGDNSYLLARDFGRSVSILEYSPGRFTRIWSQKVDINDFEFAELKLETLRGGTGLRFYLDDTFLTELRHDYRTGTPLVTLVALGHGEVAFDEVALYMSYATDPFRGARFTQN